MANQYVNKLVKDGVVKLDLTADTVTPATLAEGVTAHNAAGEQITGTLESKTYTVPDGTTSITNSTIPTPYKWEKIIIPLSVTSISSNAWNYCFSLRAFEVSADNPYFCSDSKGYLFDKNKTTLLRVPCMGGVYSSSFNGYVIDFATGYSSLTTIGDYALYKCCFVTRFFMNDNITYIGTYGVAYCRSLSLMTVSSSLITIGDYAFRECTSLTNPTFPTTVKSIGAGAFYRCVSLSSSVISSNTETVGNHAFNGCISLKQALNTAYKLSTIGQNAFWQCLNMTNGLYGSLTSLSSISKNAFESSSISYLDIASSVPITKIPNSAFLNGRLDHVYINSQTVTTIETKAFSGNIGLGEVELANGITSIASDAFSNCPNLKTITINKPSGSISGAPWGATNATVVWTG